MQAGTASMDLLGERTSIPYLLGLVVVAGFLVGVGKDLGRLGADATTEPARAIASERATAPGRPSADFEPSRFVLNALLVPALDADALPLRWVDPRAALDCGQATSVLVDGAPLRPGSLVPNVPFELAWHAADCRPFGVAGPRFHGDVRLTVFREDWGFSAIVAPHGLSMLAAGHAPVALAGGSASTPQFGADDDDAPDAAAPSGRRLQ